jgi:hypothetical protein
LPYIPESKRKYWRDQLVFDDLDPDLTHPGTLNFLFVEIIKRFVKSRGGEWDEENLNSIYGALVCCLLEVHRRKSRKPADGIGTTNDSNDSYTRHNDSIGLWVRSLLQTNERSVSFEQTGFDLLNLLRYYDTRVADYEDKKIKENGDLF